MEPLVVGSEPPGRHGTEPVTPSEHDTDLDRDHDDDWSGWDEGGAADRIGRKRDRLARLLNVASILYSKGSGDAGVPDRKSVV